jgi:hypothetical protein
MWIGGCRLTSNVPGSFAWVKPCTTAQGSGGAGGIGIDTSFWVNSEPDNHGYVPGDTTTGQFCVDVNDMTNFLLDDERCDRIAPYLCECEVP